MSRAKNLAEIPKRPAYFKPTTTEAPEKSTLLKKLQIQKVVDSMARLKTVSILH